MKAYPRSVRHDKTCAHKPSAGHHARSTEKQRRDLAKYSAEEKQLTEGTSRLTENIMVLVDA